MPVIKDLENSPQTRPSEDSAGEHEFSLLEALTILGQAKLFVLKVALGCALAALIITFIIPNYYTASTSILPPQQGSGMAAALLSQMGNLGNIGSLASLAGSNLSLKNPNDLYVSMLKSRTVEDAIIQRFELQKVYGKRYVSETRKKLEWYTTIEGGLKDGLIRISVEDRDPKRAADMANAFVEEYKKLSAHLAISEAAQRRLFFEQQLVKAKDDLANAEEDLKRTELRTGLIQLDSQARAMIETVAIVKAQIAAKEVQIQTLSTYSTPNNPNMILAQQELAALKAQLRRLGASEDENVDVLVPTKKIPEAGLEYVRKLREVKYREVLFELLSRQFEIAKLDEAKEGATVQTVDPAVIPDKKSWPRRSIFILVGLAIGLFGAVIWVLLHDSVKQSMNDPRQAREFAGLKSAWTTIKGNNP